MRDGLCDTNGTQALCQHRSNNLHLKWVSIGSARLPLKDTDCTQVHSLICHTRSGDSFKHTWCQCSYSTAPEQVQPAGWEVTRSPGAPKQNTGKFPRWLARGTRTGPVRWRRGQELNSCLSEMWISRGPQVVSQSQRRVCGWDHSQSLKRLK